MLSEPIVVEFAEALMGNREYRRMRLSRDEQRAYGAQSWVEKRVLRAGALELARVQAARKAR